VKVAAASALVGLLVIGLALVQDALDGLPFSRSASSWHVWLLGLFVGGLASLVIEASSEWLFEPDHWYSRAPRRSKRIAWSALVVATLVAALWILRRVLS
jgi:hypothetical protein